MGRDLRERVNARATTTTAVATREGNGEGQQMTLGQYIKSMEGEFSSAMPKGVEAAQLIRDALTAVRTTENLDKCDHLSVLGGLMTCAQLNLRVAVLGHAWLLPFWNKKYEQDEKGNWRGHYQAQLIIGYQGYRELAQRSRQTASVVGRVVHEKDDYDVEYGLNERLEHKPYLRGPRGEAVAYYAIVRYTNGGHSFWHISKAEAEEHRDRFAMAKYWDEKKQSWVVIGPWKDDFDSMAVKTAFLKLSKWMPKSTELAAAIAADGTVRVDLSPTSDAMFHGERPRGEFVDGEVVDDPAELSEAEKAHEDHLKTKPDPQCDLCNAVLLAAEDGA
jgi:recombination protein RecT